MPIWTHFQKSLSRKAFRAKKPDFKRLSAGTGLTETTPKRAPPSQLQKRLEISWSARVRGFESHRLRQLSPHVLIQSMRTSFCIYRQINRQNTCYNYQEWDINARNEPHGVILSTVSSRSPALFSLLMTAFRGRNQRFIMECTLLWTIIGYRPHHCSYRPTC